MAIKQLAYRVGEVPPGGRGLFAAQRGALAVGGPKEVDPPHGAAQSGACAEAEVRASFSLKMAFQEAQVALRWLEIDRRGGEMASTMLSKVFGGHPKALKGPLRRF